MCVYLFIPLDISKTDASATKRDIDIVHQKSWKPIYMGSTGQKVKGQGQRHKNIAGVGHDALVSAGF